MASEVKQFAIWLGIGLALLICWAAVLYGLDLRYPG
jgi:hypothetical protein